MEIALLQCFCYHKINLAGFIDRPLNRSPSMNKRKRIHSIWICKVSPLPDSFSRYLSTFSHTFCANWNSLLSAIATNTNIINSYRQRQTKRTQLFIILSWPFVFWYALADVARMRHTHFTLITHNAVVLSTSFVCIWPICLFWNSFVRRCTADVSN